MAGCAEEGIRKITAAKAAVILVLGLDYWVVLAIFVGKNGRHPDKNCFLQWIIPIELPC